MFHKALYVFQKKVVIFQAKKPAVKKAKPRMHKLLILEYDHNQKIRHQNLAKKAFLG